MKRIKSEEINNSVKNYVLHRNLSSNIPLDQLSAQTNNKSQVLDLIKTKSLLVDLNMMALNDLAMIESSINDYYSFSFNSNNENDYKIQFENLKDFVKKNPQGLQHIIFPIFVYLCIDLVLIGFSINQIVNNYKNEVNNELNKEQRSLLDNLLLFEFNKDLTKCCIVNKWVENKCKIRLNSKAWKKLLSFLTKSKTHLLLRIINLNLQIFLSDNIDEIDANDKVESNRIITDDKKVLSISSAKEIKDIKMEMIGFDALSNNEIKKEAEMNDDDMLINETSINPNLINSNIISLSNLNDLIEKINTQPSKINGACCFYLNDAQNSITSSSISPNFEIVSFTSEKSLIYLYQLQMLSQEELSKKNQPSCLQELIGGHSGSIFKSEFTHDSKYLLSGGEDGLVCLWDLKKAKQNIYFSNNNDYEEFDDNDEDLALISPLTCSYSGHLYPVWDLEEFSRLNLFATSSKDATARLWSFDRLYPLRVFCGHQSDVNSVRFHPNGSYLATGSSDKTIRLWSVQTSEFVRLFSGHRSRVFTVAFSPDGNYLASAGEDKKIKVWDLRSGSLYKELKGHSDIIHSLTFDNNSEIICSGGLDKTVKLWDVHQKNITIEPNPGSLNNSFSFFGEQQNLSNTSANSSGNSGKLLNSSLTSNELIRSLNVGFNVYSIKCDLQNVFYFTGVKKPIINNNNINQKMSTSLNVSQTNIFEQKFMQTNQQILLHQQKSAVETMITNRKSIISQHSKMESSISKTGSIKKNQSRQPMAHASNIRQSSISTTSRQPKKSTNQAARSSSANSSNSPQVALAESKSTINTRRRTAAAALLQANNQDTQHQQPDNSTQTNSQQNFTSNLFSNNDDLYEI